jgi:ATP-dependent RNA helicase RhlE
LYPVPAHLKGALLLELLKKTDADSVLVFARTKRRTFALQKRISRAGFRVTSLHGDRSQSQRDAALEGFKEGRYQIMVATDVAARGLDIDSISHVINYDIPDTADAYVHRIGRTGRAERTGDAFTFVTPDDDDMVRQIEKVTSQRIDRLYVDDFDYKAAQPERSSNSFPQGRQRNTGNSQKSRSRRSNRSQGNNAGSKSGYRGQNSNTQRSQRPNSTSGASGKKSPAGQGQSRRSRPSQHRGQQREQA